MNRLQNANPPTLDPDPLYVPEPPPPPAPRGCAWWLVPVLLIAIFAGPATPPWDPPNHRSHTGVGDCELAHDSPVPGGLEAGYDPSCTGNVANAGSREPIAVVAATTNPAPPQPAVPQGASIAPDASVPAASGAVGTALVGGWATFYDVGPGYYAAAGPLLREALGDWRGQLVEVVHGERSVIVEIVDACACGPRHGKPTFLDLSWEAFAALADPSVGVIAVSVELGGPVLPATDLAPHPDDERMRLEVRGDELYQEGTP